MAVKVKERPVGSGVWWLFIDHRGKRKAKKIGTDKHLAQEVAKKIGAKLILKEFKIETKDESKAIPTYKEVALVWLETHVKILNRSSTYDRYKAGLNNHIIPAIGAIPMDQIGRSDIKDMLIKHYSKGHPKASVCLLNAICSGSFVYAIDEGLITINPVIGVSKRLKIKREKSKIEPLTHEEVNLFLETCKQEKAFQEHYPFFLTAFRTGMRLGELLALKWDDVDFHGKFIQVSKSFRRGKFGPTKTNTEHRVDMSDHLIETLRELLIKRKREALETGKGEIIEVIFHRKGTPMDQEHIRKVFKRVLQKAGLRDIRLHDIRHSFASLLLTDGVTPVYVKEQLGHHSIKTTVDIYGHLIPNSNRLAVNRLDFPQPSATQAQPAQNEKKASY